MNTNTSRLFTAFSMICKSKDDLHNLKNVSDSSSHKLHFLFSVSDISSVTLIATDVGVRAFETPQVGGFP